MHTISLFQRLTITISTMLGAWLVIGLPASATTYIQTHVSIIADDTILADSDQYIADSGCTITDSAGIDHAITGAMAICAFDQAADSAGLTYTAQYYDGMGFFVSTIGDTTTASDYSQSWMFYLNNQMSMTGAGSTTVSDGDQITFAYGAYPSTPLQLTLSQTQAKTNKIITATVQYYNELGELTPLAGAQVYAGKHRFTTNEEGVVTFRFDRPGPKVVYATAPDFTRTTVQRLTIFRRYTHNHPVSEIKQQAMIKQAMLYLTQETLSDDGIIATSQPLSDWTTIAAASAQWTQSVMSSTPLGTTDLKKMVNQFDASGDTVASTDIARNILAASANGQHKRARLLGDLLATSQTACSDAYVNDEIYSTLAWTSVSRKRYHDVIADQVDCAVQFVTDSGGVALTTGGEADIDTTAAFVQMLVSVDASKLHTVQAKAIRFLKHEQNLDGGWGYAPDTVSNSSSTATALMALAAADIKPQSVRRNHRSGFHYLASVQKKSGAFAYDRYHTKSVLSLNTAYAVLALQRTALPVKPQQ